MNWPSTDGAFLSARMSGVGIPFLDVGCARALAPLQSTLSRFRPVLIDSARAAVPSFWGELADASMLIVGRRTSEFQLSEGFVLRARDAHPHLPIYAALPLEQSALQRMTSLIDAGVDDVLLFQGNQLTESAGEILNRRLLAPPPEPELRRLADAWVSTPEGRVALHIVRNACGPSATYPVGAVQGRGSRSLRNKFLGAGFPSPCVIRRVGRHLHETELRRRNELNVEEIATRVGFESAIAMRMSRHRLQKSLSTNPTGGADIMRLMLQRVR